MEVGCEGPIALHLKVTGRANQGMGTRQAGNLNESSSIAFVIVPEQEVVTNRDLVQLVRNFRMEAHAVKRIAEDESIVDVSVEEWFDSEMISRAKETALVRVPDCDSVIANQVLDAVFSPGFVSEEN